MTNPDKPAEFLPGFPVRIEFQARLYNVDDISMVVVQVEMPDGMCQNFDLTPVNCVSRQPLQHVVDRDLLVDVKTGPGRFQLELNLKISHLLEGAVLRIRIMLVYEADFQGDFSMLPQNLSSPRGGRLGLTALCSDVKYYVQPKKVKNRDRMQM